MMDQPEINTNVFCFNTFNISSPTLNDIPNNICNTLTSGSNLVTTSTFHIAFWIRGYFGVPALGYYLPNTKASGNINNWLAYTGQYQNSLPWTYQPFLPGSPGACTLGNNCIFRIRDGSNSSYPQYSIRGWRDESLMATNPTSVLCQIAAT
uniref:Uncharacterized protein n=1 Tax=Acrobeloides nanus TaxID=290746 RepID=A0A914C094_9BILA